MAASKAKIRAHRKKVSEKAAIKLIQPMSTMSVDAEPEKVKEKVRVSSRKSALVPSEGRTMGMDID